MARIKSPARAKGRAQQLLISYLRSPAGSALRVTFPANRTCAATNTRSAIYELRNALLDALPSSAEYYWIPASLQGQAIKLESRLQALSMRTELGNTLCIHDGGAGAQTDYEIAITNSPAHSLPISVPLTQQEAHIQQQDDEALIADQKMAEYAALDLQASIDRAIKRLQKYDNNIKLNLEYLNPTVGGREYEEIEAARQLLIDNNISI
jgi:hypothetical protein